ncbi:Retrotrans gag domain-containing protein [Abeliophyllum distichum]|uniref:Retrotrans gag domain-containing protein n=1 Tax=Abeliophyllum distichum TaxID=126358 RepID=A0ABD1RRI0_9LAMI
MSRSHDSRARIHEKTGSQHVDLPQGFCQRHLGETSAQTHVPERDLVLQKLEYLTHAIERLEKNQATTRYVSDSEAELPARDQLKDRRVKRKLKFSEKNPSGSKEGKNRCPSPRKKAISQQSTSVFDRIGRLSQIPSTSREQKVRRKERAPSTTGSSVQNTPNELELMKRRLAKLKAKQKNIPKEYITDRHSPFSKDILAKPLPKNLKMPQLTSYEDGNDLVGHLDRYTSWMELQGANDAIMCRAFLLTFRNRAMRWFKKLPQRSIWSWNDLSAQFVSTFMGAKAQSIPKKRPINIKQRWTESLRSYVDRFSKRIVEVDKISEDAALIAILSGLRTKR